MITVGRSEDYTTNPFLTYRCTIYTTAAQDVPGAMMTYPERVQMKVVYPRKPRNHYERMMARRRRP